MRTGSDRSEGRVAEMDLVEVVRVPRHMRQPTPGPWSLSHCSMSDRIRKKGELKFNPILNGRLQSHFKLKTFYERSFTHSNHANLLKKISLDPSGSNEAWTADNLTKLSDPSDLGIFLANSWIDEIISEQKSRKARETCLADSHTKIIRVVHMSISLWSSYG